MSVSPGYITYGPLIVSPAAFSGRRPALAVGGASWAAALDTRRIQASQIPGLASRITSEPAISRAPSGWAACR